MKYFSKLVDTQSCRDWGHRKHVESTIRHSGQKMLPLCCYYQQSRIFLYYKLEKTAKITMYQMLTVKSLCVPVLMH